MGLGSGIRDPGSGKNLFRIPDLGSRGQKGTGSRIRIRNTASNVLIRIMLKILMCRRAARGPATSSSGSRCRARSSRASSAAPPRSTTSPSPGSDSTPASPSLSARSPGQNKLRFLHNEKSITYPGKFPVLRIRDVYPGSRIRIFSIPDPRSKRFPNLDPHSHQRI
jgi:hypothetical protein